MRVTPSLLLIARDGVVVRPNPLPMPPIGDYGSREEAIGGLKDRADALKGDWEKRHELAAVQAQLTELQDWAIPALFREACACRQTYPTHQMLRETPLSAWREQCQGWPVLTSAHHEWLASETARKRPPQWREWAQDTSPRARKEKLLYYATRVLMEHVVFLPGALVGLALAQQRQWPVVLVAAVGSASALGYTNTELLTVHRCITLWIAATGGCVRSSRLSTTPLASQPAYAPYQTMLHDVLSSEAVVPERAYFLAPSPLIADAVRSTKMRPVVVSGDLLAAIDHIDQTKE